VEGFVPASVVKSRLGFSESDSNFFAAAIYMNNDPESAGETGGSFAGMITGAVRGSAVWLRQLSIMLGHRRKGLGSRAAKLVIEYLERSCGASAVFVSVVSENEPGLLFWKKLGFIGTYTMEKELFGSNRKYSITIMKKTLGSE
jgi:ribosomal protein S18 acetylase RimI-like enzyme